MAWVMGIDIGTTAVKALLLDTETGQSVTATSDEYPLYSPNAGWAEADPQHWEQGISEAIARLRQQDAKAVSQCRGIGVCGMVPALVPLDRSHRPLRRSIQQNDARTGRELAQIMADADTEWLYQRTGTVLNQQHIAPKLLWLQRYEPHTWEQLHAIVGSYDYVRGLMTGNWAIEVNWAVESGLFDVHARSWLTDFMNRWSIDSRWFGSVGNPWEPAGTLRPRMAEAWGMPSGIPVVYGSADHVASALAAGVANPGDVLIKFGGAGDILYCTATPQFHRRLYFDLHDLPGRYLLNGCMAASGSLVRWLLSRLKADDRSLPELDRRASAISPGSDGIVVLPYFLGEKTPIFDADARGVIFGLMLHHTDGHLFRAVLESVIFGFRHHLDVLSNSGFPVERIFATNGGAKSELWRQIAADVLQRPILAFPHHPGSAMGAAIVAAQGLGLLPQEPVVDRIDTPRIWHQPNPDNRSVYDRNYSVFRTLYERTHDLMHVMGRGEDS
ncbi:Xylulokinase [Sulfobacillus acidophilus DSM 10332]|uniref:Xylulokinase n=1 Tax=Sulfobacillus acidophilus (strain ATCC 700253 / DSM 10332 / NAL) TaxID=679936 RepID=G8TV15_SULAD|nr:Xylulokinase [Sulfobacillus acidophilus DSM 10332]